MPFLAEKHIDIPNRDLLSWMFNDQTYDADVPIYIDAAEPERTISSRQAKSITRKLCAGFKSIGLEKGDCVCMLSFNDIYYSMAFLGILSFGGIFAGVNPSHTPFELAHAFQIAQVKALIVEPELLPNALKAAAQANIPRSHIFIFDHHTPVTAPWSDAEGWNEGLGEEERTGGCKSWRALMGMGESDWESWDNEKRSKETVAARLFSSGTTGLPKAVDMTHHNFVTQHTMVLEYKPRDYEVVRLLCTPMFHVSNVPRAHTSPLRGGLRTYVMRRFELEAWMRNIERFQITEANMVPPMVIQIINSPLIKKYSLASIRYSWVGAAPLAAEPQARYKTLLRPDTPFNQVWGMSETSCIATMVHYPEHDPTGSVGRFLPNHDAKLVDDDGKDITDFDIRGELCVRGPLIVKGYFNNSEANKLAWDEDGYFHTGDVAVCKRENGLWYIVDRKKELIKVRGFQVAPAELEGVLLSHPDISDAAVIGIPAGGTGARAGDAGSELPRAYIVVKHGSLVREVDIQAYMKEKLAGYKQLVGGVKFVDAIPKNASGKILKKDLKEMARKETGARL
ncbi:4-coumarate-CoA ligase-like protein [Dothidotthia symphoricarpi CBS 119687]|uniref:4-coumarate-CoA ligase-like protein n=1 Tax=Dothidotthia symphoricarpi CBS 119687 TaxID=1392245 RepID=A0A6A6ALB5_9PLEO|nr:4-coumarate-CoA ligase-like protein [Dothidotthia symphoricarpi CBS 119687]KAF2132772.1 4-coumarate-CoA ligase-like protein [Dothidotthia symphoricarpi CBS 119687]